MEDKQLQAAAAESLASQWERGSRALQLLGHPGYHFTPWSCINTFTLRLWERLLEGRADSEATRFNFALLSWLGVQGLNKQADSPVPPSAHAPDLVNSLIARYHAGWGRSVATTGHSGLAVRLLDASSALEMLVDGNLPRCPEAARAFREVTICSLAAEMLYADTWPEREDLPSPPQAHLQPQT